MKYNASTEEFLKRLLKGKKVLFITHKHHTYIRNSQELKLIKKYAMNCEVICANAQLTWLNYIKSFFLVLIKTFIFSRSRYDLVFIGYLPQMILPFTPFIFGNKTIVIDFFISLYDTVVFDKKLISVKNPFAKLLHWIDSASIKKAHHVIVDTNQHKRFFSDEFGLNKENTYTLYLEADERIYFPCKKEKTASLKENFVVLYFGTILPLQGIDIILDAADNLRSDINILFQIIGPVKNKIKKTYINHENINFIPWITQNELREYINDADLCLAGHFNGTIEKARRVIAGKTFIFHKMGKEIILGDNSANKELFSEESKGIHYVEMGSAQKLSELIKCIYIKNLQAHNREDI